jgi:branched-subunit amino acid aminotransferase/4-amino-4-deoxychorismate lyase
MEELQLFTTIRCDPELMNVPDRGFFNLGWNRNPSPFYMLDLHRNRMLKAAMYWGWDAAVQTLEGDDGLSTLANFLRTNVAEVVAMPRAAQAYRAKVLIDQDGALSVVKAPTGPVQMTNLFPSYLPSPTGTNIYRPGDSHIPDRLPEWEILVDKQATRESEFTHFKTTHRPMYDEARRRAGIGLADMKEVLLVNKDDRSIMEGSITTPYFWRNNRWVTPPVSGEFRIAQGSGGNNGTTRRWALER